MRRNITISIVIIIVLSLCLIGIKGYEMIFDEGDATLKDSVGAVWMSNVPDQQTEDTFKTIVYVNTGNESLAAYGLNLSFNPQLLSIDSISKGSNGFIAASNINNDEGNASIAGFEASGVAANTELQLLEVSWTALAPGESTIIITADSLVNPSTATIGNPEGIDMRVAVQSIEEPVVVNPEILISPSDISYTEGETGNTISWTATDDNPSTYTITRDGTQVNSGNWTSGNAIIVNVDNLNPGSYSYTITLSDQDNLSVSDTVNVTVQAAPVEDPEGTGTVWIESVPTQDEGNDFDTTVYVNTGNSLVAAYGMEITFDPSVLQINSISAADPDGFVAASSIDNVAGKAIIAGFEATGSGPSSDLELFVISWSAVGAGDSDIAIEVDTLTDESTGTIGEPNGVGTNVTVETTYVPQNPELTQLAANVNYEVGETGNSLTWIATDDNPTTYTVSNGSGEVASGNWTSGTPVTVNVDGLSAGSYTYTIILTDGDGLTTTNSASVVVQEPQIIPVEGEGTVWMSNIADQKVDAAFESTVYVNTGNQKLAAYGIDISYNPAVVKIDSVSAAEPDGFVAASKIDNDTGIASIAGFDAEGKGPNTELALLNIAWTAVGAGDSDIIIMVDTLSNENTDTIGIPEGINGSVKVEGSVIPEDPNIGTVWIDDAVVENVGDTFTTNLYVNTGNQNLGAYGFDITYDANIAKITNIVAGTNGTLAAANINVPGIAKVSGFEASGLDASNKLELLVITWEAVGKGSTSVDTSIDTLIDINYADIGTPTNISSSIEVENGPIVVTSPPVVTIPVTTVPLITTPPVTTYPVGSVWMDDAVAADAGDTFKTSVYVNTGSQKIGAYGFDITYDANIAKIKNIVAGADGTLAAANFGLPGIAKVSGFDAAGLDAGNKLELLVITWEAVGKGTTDVDIDIDTLISSDYVDIGTPNGISSSIEVENGPVVTTPPVTTPPVTTPPVTTAPVTTAPVTTPPVSGDYTVDYIVHDWGQYAYGATINVIIHNNSSSAKNGWKLTFTFPGDQQITNLWCGQYTQSGRSVTIKPESWNSTIPAGGEVNLGFNLSYQTSNATPTDIAVR